MKIGGKEYTDQEAFEKFVLDFTDLIVELEDSSEDSSMVGWYSTLGQSKRDPSDDLWIFESDIMDKGWKKDELEELFDKQSQKIINYLEDKSRGVGDYFLYVYSNKEFPLSGGVMTQDPEEFMVKYSYGWQRNKYGILFLQQNGFTTEKFLNKVAESFYEIDILTLIIDNLDFDLPRGKREKYESKFRKFSIVKDNTLEIKYKIIVEILNVMNFVEGGSEYEDLINLDEFLHSIITNLNTYKGTSHELKPDSIVCQFNP